MKRLWLVLLACGGVTAAPVATDPWPTAPVLARLFILPAGKSAGQSLIRDLHLNTAHTQELKRLASSEAALGQQAGHIVGRQNAAALNRKITAFNPEKDRKVRAALGDSYPQFRSWVRTWWAAEVKKASRK